MPECLEVVTALRRLNSIDLERRQQQLQVQQQHMTGNGSSSSSSTSTTDLERAHATMELCLQVDFLEARDIWLETGTTTTTSHTTSSSSKDKGATATAITATTAEEDLLDTIERYRTRVFEVATRKYIID